MRVPQAPGCPPICSPGGRLPLTMLRMYGQSGRDVGGPPVPFSTVPKATPTLPGPTSQTPLLQAKFVVISVGALVVAAFADPAAASPARSSAGPRMAAARQSLDDMCCLPMFDRSGPDERADRETDRRSPRAERKEPGGTT